MYRYYLVLFLFIASAFISYLIFGSLKDNDLLSPLKGTVEENSGILTILKEEEMFSDDYSVAIKNLKTGKTFYHNEHQQFYSASLYKLWVMAVAFEEVSRGNLSENEELSAAKEELDKKLGLETDEIATESSEEQKNNEEKNDEEKEVEQIKMNALPAIYRMITISDNYAALLIASAAGDLKIFSFLKNENFSSSSYKAPPVTSAKDMASFFELLYKRELINREYSERMIEILKQQALNDRIPKYLPDDIEVAHKTGELGEYKHDAGIVFSKNGDYIIVVLSKTDNPAGAAEKISKFSKKIFDYFNNRT